MDLKKVSNGSKAWEANARETLLGAELSHPNPACQVVNPAWLMTRKRKRKSLRTEGRKIQPDGGRQLGGTFRSLIGRRGRVRTLLSYGKGCS